MRFFHIAQWCPRQYLDIRSTQKPQGQLNADTTNDLLHDGTDFGLSMSFPPIKRHPSCFHIPILNASSQNWLKLFLVTRTTAQPSRGGTHSSIHKKLKKSWLPERNRNPNRLSKLSISYPASAKETCRYTRSSSCLTQNLPQHYRALRGTSPSMSW